MIRVGIVGQKNGIANFIDSINKISEMTIYEFSSLCDINIIEKEIHNIDALIISYPSGKYIDIAKIALKNFKHIFIGGNLTENLIESWNLLKLVDESQVKVQVSNIDLLHPAFLAIKPYINGIQYIEAKRNRIFTKHTNDKSVVQDLMLADIEIVLAIVKSSVKKIIANGFGFHSKTIDFANVRIEFENGCVANLTANRRAENDCAIFEIHSAKKLLVSDFTNNCSSFSEWRCLSEEENTAQNIEYTRQIIPIIANNPLELELKSFVNSIIHNLPTISNIEISYNALLVANQIVNRILPDNN